MSTTNTTYNQTTIYSTSVAVINVEENDYLAEVNHETVDYFWDADFNLNSVFSGFKPDFPVTDAESVTFAAVTYSANSTDLGNVTELGTDTTDYSAAGAILVSGLGILPGTTLVENEDGSFSLSQAATADGTGITTFLTTAETKNTGIVRQSRDGNDSTDATEAHAFRAKLIETLDDADNA